VLLSSIPVTDTPVTLRRLGGVATPGLFRGLIDYVTASPLRRRVRKALALTPRAFVRHDLLVVCAFSAQIRVEWRSRDIHPWDADLPADRRAALFREQALCDTDAAIVRLFQILPDLDTIEIRVLEPHADRLLLAGTVERQDVVAARSLSSPGMRLKVMGVRYHVRDGQLEP